MACKRDAMFLTVTNKGSKKLNMERLQQEFPEAAACLQRGIGLPGDTNAGGGLMVFREGMRIRLTRNLDKDRGFVNGTLGTIELMLRQDVFVLRTNAGNRLLVHPVHDKEGSMCMPCVYGYAMTIRRAQGSTLDCAILHFDRLRPDRGYAYVGASRVRAADYLIHMGHLRRTDWLPVGKDPRRGEQIYPSQLSDSDDSNADASESDFEGEEASDSDFAADAASDSDMDEEDAEDAIENLAAAEPDVQDSVHAAEELVGLFSS